MTAKEIEIQNLMKKLNISRAEAEQLWADDNSDEMTPEQAELEAKAKKAGRHYEATEKVKQRKVTRERKVDEVKSFLLRMCKTALENCGAQILNTKTETELTFTYQGETYTLKLTKHRKQKEG